ncbi:hypothetical protein AB0D37_38595 [Streptomyces sp. NPDC048384]|uniref:hypothetical protein n=1 Tax=Streptomyces sp. NPDC048384 TaxID=3155487 RepID=UPI0034449747
MLVDKAGLYRLTSSAGHPWVDLDQPMRVHRAAGAGTLAGVVGTFANAVDFSALGALTSLAALTVPPALAYVRVGTATGWQRISRWATTRKDKKTPPAPEALLTATDGITHVASDGLDLLRTPDGYLATALVTAPSAPDTRDSAGERWGEVLAWAADAVPGIRLALSVVSGPVGRGFMRVPEGLAKAARAIAGQAVGYRSYLTVLVPSRTAQSAADSVRALLAQAATAGMTLTPLSAGELSHLMAGQLTGSTVWPSEVTPAKGVLPGRGEAPRGGTRGVLAAAPGDRHRPRQVGPGRRGSAQDGHGVDDAVRCGQLPPEVPPLGPDPRRLTR